MFNLFKQFFLRKPTGVAADKKIIAAKVLAIEKHPNADRLILVKVDTGAEIFYPIVCGAHNFKVGDMVVLALPGATIRRNIHSDTHESFALTKAIIRGVESQGMLCAAFELGLSNEIGEGIMILPGNTALGSVPGIYSQD